MKKRGRPPGYRDKQWPDRMILLLVKILSIQAEQYTVSLRELEEACQVSRQTICNWLEMAEHLGYVNRHRGKWRGLELLPDGRKLAQKFQKGVAA